MLKVERLIKKYEDSIICNNITFSLGALFQKNQVVYQKYLAKTPM